MTANIRRFSLPVIVLLGVVLAIPQAQSEEYNGGYGLQHVTSARSYLNGGWSVQSYSDAYLVDPGTGMESNVTIASGLNYGIGYNFELEATGVLYQDYIGGINAEMGQIGGETPVLNDLYLRWKWGNQRLFGDLPILFGLQGTVKYKAGDYYNRALSTLYDSWGTTGQLNLLFSYYRNMDEPDNSFQFHYNFGYINFNDGNSITESTDALRALWGFYIPMSGLGSVFEGWSYWLEGRAIYYNNYPDMIYEVNSQENNAYVTSSFSWEFMPNWAFTFGVDFKVYEDEFEYGDPMFLDRGFSNLPTWRLNYQVSYRPAAGYAGYGSGGGFGGFRGGQQGRGGYPPPGAYGSVNRGALYDWGGSIREDIEYMEIELDKIREERKEAEEKLRNLKDKVQKKKSGN
ncbi:hypothetical protein GF324_01530 [bacterium]|nr:hypothetical protein [bacterium]